MTKRRDLDPRQLFDEPPPEGDEFDPYAPPEELSGPPAPSRRGRRRAAAPPDEDEVSLDFGTGEAPPPARRPIPRAAIGIAVAVLVAGALLGYRAVSHRKALRTAVAQAEADVRADTADGYRKAAAILSPFAEGDPLEAGALRAFALGMLALDYRDAAARDEAETLLVDPERADAIPRWANLARAAVALSRDEAGTSMTAASRAAGDPMAGMLEGRIALAAGNLEAALEPLHAAAAAEPPLPAALALHGDAVRRAKRDARAARAAYARALEISPAHPRAAYGLAKLALMGQLPPAEAGEALDRVAADPATPPNEKARARLHAAALAIRAGDRARAASLLDGLGLDAAGRDWADRAAALGADTGRVYRAVQGAPDPLQSASDDDPPVLPPVVLTPEPPPAPAKVTKPAAKRATATKKAPAKRTTTRRTRR